MKNLLLGLLLLITAAVEAQTQTLAFGDGDQASTTIMVGDQRVPVIGTRNQEDADTTAVWWTGTTLEVVYSGREDTLRIFVTRSNPTSLTVTLALADPNRRPVHVQRLPAAPLEFRPHLSVGVEGDPLGRLGGVLGFQFHPQYRIQLGLARLGSPNLGGYHAGTWPAPTEARTWVYGLALMRSVPLFGPGWRLEYGGSFSLGWAPRATKVVDQAWLAFGVPFGVAYQAQRWQIGVGFEPALINRPVPGRVSGWGLEVLKTAQLQVTWNLGGGN